MSSKTKRRTLAASREAVEATSPDFPAWLAPAAYALVTLILFREVVAGTSTLLGQDSLALSYFARNFYTEFVRAFHTFPLWNPYLFGGLPFVEGMHGDIFYPPSIALFFMDAKWMWGWKMLIHIWLAGVFTYLWLRGLGLRREISFFGGLAYMMGAHLVSLVHPGGDGKLFVSALAPLVFWLTERAMTRRGLPDFALFSLGVAAAMLTSHMQLAYYLVWGISLYAIFRMAQIWRAERRPATVARLFGLFTLAGLLAVGASAVQFFPPLAYLREWSHRADRTVRAEQQTGYEFSTSWSMHPEEAMSLMVPEFVGDNVETETRSGTTYWGRNAMKLNSEYTGFITLFLAPLVFLRRRGSRTWFFVVLALLSLSFALGATTPLFRLYYLIPGVSLMRAPSLIIFLWGLSLVTLAAFALQRYLDWAVEGTDEERRAVRRYLWIGTAVVAGLAVLASAGVLTDLWQAVIYRDMDPRRLAALQENLPRIQAGFWIVTLFAAAVAGLWEALARGLIGRRAVLVALALLAALDLYRVGRPFIRATELLNSIPALGVLFTPDESIRFLQERQAAGEVFRAYSFQPPFLPYDAYPTNTLAIHGIEQFAGHHGNEIGRYRTLLGGETPYNLATSELRLLDLANVSYVLTPGPIQPPEGFVEAFRGSRSVVYRNTNALPRAYLVGNVEVVPDDAAVERILGPDFDYRTTAALPEPLPPGIEVRPDPQGGVRWVERGINAYTLEVTSDRPALLVIAENYFPAWHAEVDGESAPVLRANYTFRAVPIPAGTHTVRLYYESELLRASAATSVGLLLLLLAVGVGGTALRARRGAASGPAAVAEEGGDDDVA